MKTHFIRAVLPIGILAVFLSTGCQRGSSTKPALVLIEGSCAVGRPVGNLVDYSTKLRAKKNDLGYIRIRANAAWDSNDHSNIIGTVPSGTILWGEGPLKSADYGIGYAVAVRDGHGISCRGYVSESVVEPPGP